MLDDIKKLVIQLKLENKEREAEMQSGNLTDKVYNNKFLVHTTTLNIIKKIENIIGEIK